MGEQVGVKSRRTLNEVRLIHDATITTRLLRNERHMLRTNQRPVFV